MGEIVPGRKNSKCEGSELGGNRHHFIALGTFSTLLSNPSFRDAPLQGRAISHAKCFLGAAIPFLPKVVKKLISLIALEERVKKALPLGFWEPGG